MEDTAPDRESRRAVIVIGDDDLADETARAVAAADAPVVRLRTPDEDDVRHALDSDGIRSVIVVARNDAIVLRFALMVRAASEDVPLLLTIFDETMAERMSRELANTWRPAQTDGSRHGYQARSPSTRRMYCSRVMSCAVTTYS